MARRGSVAPKERINIVYKPKISGDEDVELPFKMLIMADLTGKPNDIPVEDRKPLNIDKDNYKDVLKSLDLGVDVNVPDRVSGEEDAQLPVSLRFKSLKDFTPEGIAHQVPELQRLLDLRDALSSLKSPLGNRPQFRKRIQAILSDDKARQQLLEELGVIDGGEAGED
jgi:type VI secretion system protein ImpB